jgi:hypothetical protein
MKNWTDQDLPSVEKVRKSNIGKTLEAKVNRIYAPATRIDTQFRGKDLTLFTNEKGEVTSFHYGRRKENGDISGERFFRRIKKTAAGKMLFHWDKQK